MKNIEKEIVNFSNISKEMLKEKNEQLIKELNDYKIEIEEIEKNSKKDNMLIDYSEDKSLEKDFDFFEYDCDEGYKFSLDGVDEDSRKVVYDVFEKDPLFALNFIERKKDVIPSNEYENIKEKLIKKLNLK